MEFEWDEAKRQTNLRKHGIDDRFDYGEERFVTLGMLKGRVVVVAHTENRRVIRIISVRKATKYEEISYFKGIAD